MSSKFALSCFEDSRFDRNTKQFLFLPSLTGKTHKLLHVKNEPGKYQYPENSTSECILLVPSSRGLILMTFLLFRSLSSLLLSILLTYSQRCFRWTIQLHRTITRSPPSRSCAKTRSSLTHPKARLCNRR